MSIVDTFSPADAERLVDRIFAQYLAPPPRLTVSEWADQFRILSRKAAAAPGPYRTDVTPYLREPMDLLSPNSLVEEVVLMFPAQVGKSEAGNNFIGHSVDVDPCPVMIVQPTIDLAKRYSRQRIAPMIEETPALRRRVRENRSRDEANTTLLKDFTGGFLVLAGANSAAGLRSVPVRKLFLDEIDAYPLDVDGEGDPIALAEKRTDTFVGRRKLLKTSTPTLKGFSRIESAFEAGDKRRYHVACVHCAQLQVLEFRRLNWVRDDVGAPIPGSVRYVCQGCGGTMSEADKPALLRSGRWVAEKPLRKVASFHLNALYSPWLPWEAVVASFYEANEAAKAGDVSKLKAWTNTVLAETWEDDGDRVSESELAKRADPALKEGLLPRWALVATAGCDVQADRVECYVWAWGRGERSVLVGREIVYGSPADENMWRAVDQVLKRELEHESGARVRISAAAIDAGFQQNEVVGFCRARAWRRVFAVKGQSQAGKAILGKPTDVDVNYRGQKIRKGGKLWPVGGDTGKVTLYGRLRLSEPGPGYVHLGKWLPAEVFEQLTAERLVTKYHKGRPRLEWMKPAGRRNEALDCAVYALAAAHFLGVPRWRENDWRKLEAQVLQAQLLHESAEQDTDGSTPVENAEASAEAPAAAASAAAAPTPAAPASRKPRVVHNINRKPWLKHE